MAVDKSSRAAAASSVASDSRQPSGGSFNTTTAPLAPTGIPSLRSLRSLLPFVPNKQPSNLASNGIRGPFSNFGTVRRSTSDQKEKERASQDLLPVIAIGPSTTSTEEQDERVVRRSISCSGLPLTIGRESNGVTSATVAPPTLRTPSPGPPITADLSMILEANMSAISVQQQYGGMTLDLQPSHSHQGNQKDIVVPIQSQFQPSPRKPIATTSSNDTVSAKPLTGSPRTSMLPRYTHNNVSPSPPFAQEPAGLPSGFSAESSKSVPTTSSLPTMKNNKPPAPPPLSSHLRFPSACAVPRAAHACNDSDKSTKPSPLVPPLVPPRVASPFKSHTLIAPDSVRSLPASTSTPKASPLVLDPHSPPHSPPTQPISSPDLILTTPRGIPLNSTDSRTPLAAIAQEPTRTRRLQHKRSVSAFELSPPPPPAPNPRSSISPERTVRGKESLKRPVSTPEESSPEIPDAQGNPSIPSSSNLGRPFQPHQQRLRTRRRSMSVQEQLSTTPYLPRGYRGKPGFPRGGGSTSVASQGQTFKTAFRRGGASGSPSPPPLDHDDHDGDDGSSAFEVGRWGKHPREFGTSSSLSGRIRTRSTFSSEVGSPVARTVNRHYRLGAPEWLGPRSIKALKAAGLLDPGAEDREGGLERDVPLSTSGVGWGRLAMTRSISEYNPRVPSRMAFSEVGGGGHGSAMSVGGDSRPAYGGDGWRGLGGATVRGRRGSDHTALGSPTHTAESSASTTTTRERSSSTAPTTLSTSSSFFGAAREREYKDRALGTEASKMSSGEALSVDAKELRDLKDRHATETGALLHALSDSQRTARVLREENEELRGRLGRLADVERENDELRREVSDLRVEVGALTAKGIWRTGAAGFVNGERRMWTMKKSALGRSFPIGREDLDDTEIDEDNEPSSMSSSVRRNWHFRGRSEQHRRDDKKDDKLTMNPPPPTPSTPIAISSKRQMHGRCDRFSTSSIASSTFPTIPDNMSMLMHDNNNHNNNNDRNDDYDEYMPIVPPPGAASKGNISPTTTSFSVLSGTNPGSPGSMVLRPEHELHLCDMESLDLGSMKFEEQENESSDW